MEPQQNTTEDTHEDIAYEGEDASKVVDLELEESEELRADALKKMRGKLKACEAEKQEYLTGWQRSKADFVNAKKQQETERASFATFAAASLIEDIIPVLQSFDSAMSNKEVWESAPANWRVGVEYIRNQLLETLENRGLSIIDPLDTIFDPLLHEAVENLPVDEEEKNGKVIRVLQRGYILGGKTLRPARVVVGSKQ